MREREVGMVGQQMQKSHKNDLEVFHLESLQSDEHMKCRDQRDSGRIPVDRLRDRWDT
jgi:hypothetical protein